MGIVDRKLELLDSIARLRRAQRRVPGDRDLALVRTRLEDEIGDTVSRRIAARFLDVSHTALDRWIKAGDLPVVQNVKGRGEVPVPALLGLAEQVREQRELHQDRGHVLEPIMNRGRDRAQAIQIDHLLPSREEGVASGHSRADRRALAYHRAVARRLDRRMVDEARHRVWKWHDQEKLDSFYADEWERLLARPVKEVRKAIVEDSPRGRDLRQNSPFAGMLSEPERRRIVQALN